MSKILDEMRSKYGSSRKPEAAGKARHGSSRKLGDPGKARSPRRKPNILPVRRPAEAPESPARVDRHLVSSPFLKASHRHVEGLDWTNIEGVDVLRPAGKWASNYVASPAVRPAGTFAIYRLKPRSIVVQRIKTKDVLHQIERLIQQDEEAADRERKRQQEAEEKERAEAWRLEHQPGFYIIPGEIVEGEGGEPVPIGPFWRFERAGSQYDRDDFEDDSWAGNLDDDVEDDAVALMRALREEERKGLIREHRLTPVRIIESPNREAAAREKGHVWWSDGVFRGPPVDPRQAGWGW